MAALKALPSVVVGGGGGTASLAGKVLRADTDEPLAGLTVQLLSAGKQIGKTDTAADGGFTFANIAAGTYDLTIDPYGVVRRGVTAVEGGGPPVIIRLAGGKSSVLSGSVQNASGAPVAGIEVSLLPRWDAAVKRQDARPTAHFASKG